MRGLAPRAMKIWEVHHRCPIQQIDTLPHSAGANATYVIGMTEDDFEFFAGTAM
jgi:hypothetical protein